MLSYVDRPATLQNLGVVRAGQGRFEEAASAFVSALETTEDPQARQNLRRNLARVAKHLGPAEQR